jgi:3-dehydroquinate dehydratase/shikimate dehydrogenase
MPLLTDMETAADAIGAVNTVVFDGIKRIGYNTDYRAAMESLADTMSLRLSDERTFGGKRVLILGAGGVARAIGWGLQQRGAEVYISGRNQDKLNRMTHFMGANPVAWERRHELPPEILVNATPVGMYPEIHQTPFEGTSLIHSMVVFDTIYNPEHTMLINLAQRTSCKVITGVDMFVRQAAYQYKLFVDEEAPIESMYLALRKATSPAKYLFTDDPDIQAAPEAGKSADGDVLDWLSDGKK